MPIKKEARNRAFWVDWKEKGLSGKELGSRYGLKISGVMGLKKVLNMRYKRGWRPENE